MAGLTLFSLSLLLAGSFLLGNSRYPWDGGLLVLLGLASYLGVFLRLQPRRLGRWTPVLVDLDHRRLIRWGAATASLLFTFAAGYTARARPPGTSHVPSLGLWCVALLLFGIANARLSLSWDRIAGRRLRRAMPVGLLLLAAFLVRCVALSRIPINFGGDEGTQALLGVQLVEAPFGNPFAAGWYSVPTFSFMLYGLAMRLVGASIAGARLLSVLAGTATVLTTFLLGRELGGERVGWAAALTVAAAAYHIHFSRLASNQIFDPLIATLALWLLWRALRRELRSGSGSPAVPDWGWAGLAAGVGWYLYFGARWVTVLIGLTLVWRMLAEPAFLKRHWRGIGMLALGWVVATLPLWLWYAGHPADLTARMNAVSIFASGWLEREVVITGKPALALLFQQFWKSISAFHLTPDPTFWYYPRAPLLDFVAGALMLLGLLEACLHWRRPSRFLVLLWFLSTLTAAWTLTENPPSSQRGLLLVPPAAFLVAWGVDVLWRRLASRPRVQMGVILVLATAVVTFNLTFYFAVYTPRGDYGNPTAQVATAVARRLLAEPLPEAPVRFYGAPQLYWDFGALAFLLRGQEGVDVLPGHELAPATCPTRFVFILDLLIEYQSVAQAYPGGATAEIRNPAGDITALIYDWTCR